MPEMEKAVAAVRAANQSRNINVKVMVGGPPVNEEFAGRIGADAYGMDAPGAVECARGMVGA
jgi:methanogenic corrinoid protein MtbC1